MNIQDCITNYLNNGYQYNDAISKVCQDIILLKLSNSRFSKNITIKGGVVMHNISKDKRRATRDLDLDFIKYSIEDSSIINFINELNKCNDGLTITIDKKIKPLNQQAYNGKRIYLKISDKYNNALKTKIDIGVHKLFDIKQDEYCFDINGKSIKLYINSFEQIFTEKLKSLLKLGIRSTRYKDLFDFYYLINYSSLDKQKLLDYFDILIFSDITMKENKLDDIIKRLDSIFSEEEYRNNLTNPKVNWLEIPVDHVIKNILEYLLMLDKISV